MLFLIFINDLLDVLQVLAKLFAGEDMQENHQWQDTEPVQRSVTNATTWAKYRDMLFNDTKCHHLHVGKHDLGHVYTMVTTNGEHDITKVDSEKDLGVTIDKNLTFREHICQQK